MDLPLTITSIMRYGTSVFGDGEVVTWTGDGTRRRTYAEAGRRAARLANALRGLGVDGDQRVGTFMWNNAEHLEAYLAIPSMGAVLHTLNIRLAAAERRLHRQPRRGPGRHRGRLAGPPVRRDPAQRADRQARDRDRRPARRDAGNRPAHRRGRAPLRGPARRRGGRVRLARRSTSTSAAAMCYTSGTTGQPEGRRLQPPVELPALDGRLPRERRSASPSGTACCPSCRCSTPTRGACRTPACCPAPPWSCPTGDLTPRHAGPAHRRRARHRGRRGADDLGRAARLLRSTGGRPVLAAPGRRGRLRGAARADGEVRAGARRAASCRPGA